MAQTDVRTAPGRRRWRRPAAAIAALALILTGCGLQVPADPNGALERVAGGTLRVGASPDPGLVDVPGGDPEGPLVTLVEDFARSIDADTDWIVASEETLVTALEQGDIDLAVGGFTDQSPWLDRAGMTRGYPRMPGADGRPIVLLVPLGENAMLSALESFLDEEVGP